MISVLARKIFGTKNERLLKSVQPIVEQINSLEAELKELEDSALKAKTPYFKEKLEHADEESDLNEIRVSRGFAGQRPSELHSVPLVSAAIGKS